MITASQWQDILQRLGVKSPTAQTMSVPFADEVQADKFSAGEADLVAWLPQILHECSMLERFEECLSYSPERICVVWPGRFPTLASAAPYEHAPQKLANLVYGGRMGNVHAGDGWVYRGRSPIMATGLDAYLLLSRLCGQDFDQVPDLLLQPHFGLCAAIHWWENRIPDSMLSDQVKLRKKVNGGTEGLAHVQALAQLTRKVFA